MQDINELNPPVSNNDEKPPKIDENNADSKNIGADPQNPAETHENPIKNDINNNNETQTQEKNAQTPKTPAIKPVNSLKKTIPFFIEFLNSFCLIDKRFITNANSFFKSDFSVESEDGTKSISVKHEDIFLLFDVAVNKILLTEPEKNKADENKNFAVINAVFDIDIYGDYGVDIANNIYLQLLSGEALIFFNQNNIAIYNLSVEVNSGYETINGVVWSRSNIKIPFNYKYINDVKNMDITAFGEKNIFNNIGVKINNE